MRRLLIALTLLFLTVPAFGAAKTVTVDGDWTVGATWGGSAPTANDTCTIPVDHQVYCNDATCICASLDLVGSLSITGNGTLTAGEFADGNATPDESVTYSVFVQGYLGIEGGGTLSLDCVDDETANCEVSVAADAFLHAQGTEIARGTIGGVSNEDCPLGTFGSEDGITEIATCAASNISVTVSSGSFDKDSLAGYVLIPLWPSQHRGQWYDIVSNQDGTIVLDYASRGQLEPHGKVYADASVTTSGTSVTDWGTTIVSDTIQGGYFYLDADCAATAEASPVAHNLYLPCEDARRIVSISGTTITLAAAAPRDVTEAATVVLEGGSVWPSTDYIEQFRPGDPFIIINPASIESAVQSITAQTANSYIQLVDDASINLKYTQLEFMGRGDSVVEFSAIENSATSGNTGTFSLEFVEVSWYGGAQAVDVREVDNPTINYLTIRDALTTDVTSQYAHGLQLSDYTPGGGTMTINNFRSMKTGDDGIVGNEPAGIDLVTINKPVTLWCDVTNPGTASCQGIEFNALPAGGIHITEALVYGARDGCIQMPSVSGTWTNGWLVQNSYLANCRDTGIRNDAGSANNAYSKRSGGVINSVIKNSGIVNSTGVRRMNVYSSLIDGSYQGLGGVEKAKGVMIHGDVANFSHGFDTSNADNTFFDDGALEYEDVASVGRDNWQFRCGVFGGGTTSTYNVTASHLTCLNDIDENNESALRGEGDSTVATVQDSIFWGYASYAFTLGSGTPTWTEDYNFVTGNKTGGVCNSGGVTCTNGASGSNDITAGFLGYASLASDGLNLTPTPGSTPFTMTTSDGTPAGARVAGPSNWNILYKVYPPLRNSRPGIYIPAYNLDDDGDGIYNVHDNCDGTYNPLQKDSESCE